ncbi:Hypothetical protein A7982_04011 [Minicystis rosea]|nr:Hypothetical protein A7982_04011 [Minicystis rosea]
MAACGFQTNGQREEETSSTSSSASSSSSSSSTSASSSVSSTSSSATSSSGNVTTGSGGGTTGSGGATTGSGGTGGGGTGGMDAGPVTFASCKQIHQMDPTKPSAIYDLTPINGSPYKAYCEMTESNGGWTLALKIDGNDNTFEYDKAIWKNMNGYAEDKPGLDQQEAKLASYWSLPFTEVLLGMIDGDTTRWKKLTLGGDSLYALISPDQEIATTETKEFWEGLLASGSIQEKCNWQGVNANKRIRIGLVGDESNDCKSPDSVIGFGIKDPSWPSCGNHAAFGPDHGDRDTKTFGYVLVR